MEFGVLGPVTAWVDGRPVDIGPPKRRLLLAVLLLELGRVVSVDRLVDLLWDEEPPPAARRVVFAHISRLRQVLTASGVRLETAAPGYVLHADPELVDAHRFRRLVSRAQNTADRSERGELLRAALALWRADALSDVAEPAVRDRLCRPLDDLRLSATEDRIDADLLDDRHRELVGELTELVGRYPTRERLVGLLMRALYRSARQTEALAAYRQLRRRLVDELGIEPGPELGRLHEAMLRNDPALDPRDPGGPAPAQLPAGISGFTGRAAQLKELDELLATDATIALVTGSAGIGKTALAVHWGHRVRGQFPDGQLHVNLRGFAPTPALRPIDALGQLLPALGVPIEDVPVDVDRAAALYRSCLSDRQVLVVLDNAAAADQVRPLLPGGSQCLAVVTSRNRLAGLVARDGARRVDLDVLAPDEALALLADVLGPEQVRAEPEAATELAERCAFLPLALRIAAAKLLDRPGIHSYVAELTEHPLAALAVESDPDAAVRVALDLSYAKLPADVRRLFRCLGLVPGPDWTVEVAATLVDQPVERVRVLAGRLVSAHLVEERVPGRYSSHDLLRQYAREQAMAEDQAQRRLFDWYLDAAHAAARLLNPEMVRLVPPDARLVEHDSAPAAMRWLDDERANLIAAVGHAAAHGPRQTAWLLADALRSYFAVNRRTADWLVVARHGLYAAEAEGDLCGQAAAHLSLAQAHHRGLDDLATSIEHNRRARSLARQAGWSAGEATALGNLGNGYRAAGRLAEAVECYREALDLERQAGRIAGQGFALSNLGVLLTESGRLTEAVEHFGQALALRRAAGYRAGEARTLCFLADAVFELGRPQEAGELLREAIRLYREVGERVNEAAALASFAKVRSELGETDRALAEVRSALDILRDYPSRWIEAVLLGVLATIEQRQGRPDDAAAHRHRALRLARAVGNRYQEANLLVGLANDHRLLGRLDDAGNNAEAALTLTRRLGFRVLEGEALTAIAEIDLARGHRHAAREHARQALALQRETGHRLGLRSPVE